MSLNILCLILPMVKTQLKPTFSQKSEHDICETSADGQKYLQRLTRCITVNTACLLYDAVTTCFALIPKQLSGQLKNYKDIVTNSKASGYI
jgi:hypothetical protein